MQELRILVTTHEIGQIQVVYDLIIIDLGICIEGGSFSTNVPLPRSPYGSVKMTIYFDIINLVGNYMVVNEQKSPYENKSF